MKLQPSCHTEQISAQHETRLGELWKNWWLMDSMQTLCTTPCFIRWTPSSHSISRSPGESSFHSETGVSVSGPWEWSEQWEGAPSLALAKQGWRAFVCASAPRIASSSWKTRHKEAAEEPDKPPPVSSRTCHDSPRPDRGQSSSSRGPFVFLIIQITTWGGDKGWPWQHRLCAFLLLQLNKFARGQHPMQNTSGMRQPAAVPPPGHTPVPWLQLFSI